MGLGLDDGHTGLVIGGLNVHNQTPFKTGAQAVLQGGHIAGPSVGGHDDLLVVFKQLVEGVEKLLLGTFLTGDELNIINEEQVCLPVLTAEFDILTGADSLYQFVGKLIALDVDHVGAGVFLADAIGDGIQQVGLTHTGRAVQKQGVIGLTGGLGNR